MFSLLLLFTLGINSVEKNWCYYFFRGSSIIQLFLALSMNNTYDAYQNSYLECGSFPDMEKVGVSPLEKLSRNKPKMVYSRNLLKMARLQCSVAIWLDIEVIFYWTHCPLNTKSNRKLGQTWGQWQMALWTSAKHTSLSV